MGKKIQPKKDEREGVNSPQPKVLTDGPVSLPPPGRARRGSACQAGNLSNTYTRRVLLTDAVFQQNDLQRLPLEPTGRGLSSL